METLRKAFVETFGKTKIKVVNDRTTRIVRGKPSANFALVRRPPHVTLFWPIILRVEATRACACNRSLAVYITSSKKQFHDL